MTDNLIEEARKAGTSYIASFKCDLKAVCADLRRRAKEEGRIVVAPAPKPPHSWQVVRPKTVKKAG